MTDNLIITISRQYGSNGRHIGMALAKELGIAFYDKELIKLAASQNGISEKMFEE
ncbi:MAG: cytidylate kinase family protein, partial [Angelakisella sp.]